MTKEAEAAAPVVADMLERATFAKSLVRHVAELAAIPPAELPAPRVLAVDAPWGYGKSWIAGELQRQLKEADASQKVALVDAFRYDYHADAFAVIASAVLQALAPNEERKAKFLKRAGAVMKLAAPFAVKAAAKAVLGLANLDYEDMAEDLRETIEKGVDGAADLSGEEIGKLFESYAHTERTQEEFQRALGDMTKELSKPLVVIIDELDRCRPTFALEVLERIKHLFSADNVVFVLFWNSASIQESIKHTYGSGVDAEQYLTKFTALSIPVPVSIPGRRERGRYRRFIFAQANALLPGLHDQDAYADTLAHLAVPFDASLRDLQRAVHLTRICPASHHEDSELVAFVALLWAVDEGRCRALARGDRQTAEELSKRLPQPGKEDQVNRVVYLWALLKYTAYPESYKSGADLSKEQVLVWNTLNLGQYASREQWIPRVARQLEDALTHR